MKIKKRNAIYEVKNVYGLFQTPGYDRFVINGGAPEMMRKNWIKVGQNLTIAASKVVSVK